METKKIKKALLQAVKIGVGSSAAIYLAQLFGLESASSAGTIALLTIVATRWETFRLSLLRIITFAIAVALSWLTIVTFRSAWVAYGVYIFAMVMICEVMGWKATLSVNAVIGTHFLNRPEFTAEFILNEFGLVLIGISIAIVLNLFHNNRGRRAQLVQDMRYTEQQMQMILREVASYLLQEEMVRSTSVWDEIKELEQKLHGFIDDAYEYQNNTFPSHPVYYINYFEMRMNQFHILHNLHKEMKKIRQMPSQAALVAEYVLYLADNLSERDMTQEQIARLEDIVETIGQGELPATREEFESRAILYHILMDIEEFVTFKRWFVKGLDEKQRRIYWEREDAKQC